MIAPFVYSDQQRDTGDKSKGCCSINAFSLIAGIPWAEAKELLTCAGWRNRRGIHRGWTKLVPGWRFIRVVRKTQTVNRFLKRHPQGRFIVRKRYHIFAVIDGKVYDWGSRGRMVRLTHAWRVEKKVEKSPCQTSEGL